MTTEVIVTGSGFPVADANRAGPGLLIRTGGMHLQFDAGRSTVQRLAGAGVAIPDITAFFATHHHSDHLSALPDLVMTRWNMAGGAELEPLDVVVPAGPCERFAEQMLDIWTDDLDVRMLHTGRARGPETNIIAFPYPEQVDPVWERSGVTVCAGQVRHEPVHPAIGFRVETDDGVVAISGDTIVCDEVAALAQGADVLVYEAMLFDVILNGPPGRRHIANYHADSKLIGAQAEACGVKTLVLTHLIPAPANSDDKQLYVDDVRTGGFTGDVLVADDLDMVTLG